MSAPALEELQKIPIFRRFTLAELKTVQQATQRQDVAQEEVLIAEGDRSDFICFVVDGRLDVIKKTFTGEQIIINALSRGQSFGEMALMEKSPRSATVKAVTPSSLVILSRAQFDALIRDHPEVAVKILMGISMLLSKKLRQTNSRLINYMATRLEPSQGAGAG